MIPDRAIDLSNHRLEKALDLLDQAKLLLKEGKYDGSVNRSYYAIFSAIRAVLALIGLDARKHRGVITYFDRYFVKTGIFEKHFSKIVHASFDVRQASDYEDFFVIPAEHAIKQLEDGGRFIKEARKIVVMAQEDKMQLPEITDGGFK